MQYVLGIPSQSHFCTTLNDMQFCKLNSTIGQRDMYQTKTISVHFIWITCIKQNAFKHNWQKKIIANLNVGQMILRGGLDDLSIPLSISSTMRPHNFFCIDAIIYSHKIRSRVDAAASMQGCIDASLPKLHRKFHLQRSQTLV